MSTSFLPVILLALTWSAEPDSSLDLSRLPAAATQTVRFREDVEPLLSRACWGCHSRQAWESGLRLDRRDRALLGGDGGTVIEVGQSARSRLIHYVSGLVPDKQMPPDEEPLSAAEIGILRAWIDQGLEWPESPSAGPDPAATHWAFQTIRRPAVPAGSAAHPIDRFVEAALRQHQIAASPPADRVTLLRRLSLDLLGLSPTPEEVAEFVADARPNAYARLVDRLLASPHFGERWGRHWLDMARYADTDGYEKDLPRPYAYRYRDWVMEALNSDLPFDQFTIEQLAGDLLPNATLDQKLATGFHRQTLTNREGGIDPREDRDKQLVDRTNTTGAVWMGLTMGCAQCHTHKYDPISQREYYQLYAFFNAAQEVEIDAPTPLEAERYTRMNALHSVARQPLVERISDYQRARLPAEQAAWEQRSREEPIAWSPAPITQAQATSSSVLTQQPDQSWLVTGDVPDSDVYKLQVPAGSQRPTGFLLEVLPHAGFPQSGPGRAENGNFVVSEVQVGWRPANEPQSKFQKIPVVSGQADFEQNRGSPREFTAVKVFDGDLKTGWAIAGAIGQPHSLVVELDWANVKVPSDEILLEVTLDQRYGGQHVLGSFRLQMTTAARPLSLPQFPESIAASLKLPAAERTAEQQRLLSEFYARIDPELIRLQGELKALDAKGPQPPATKGLAFGVAAQLPETHVHLRGDFLSPGAVVTPAVLNVLNPLTKEGETPTRLDLARWLVSPEHPLTRRVTVNRVWQHLFGRGIVDPPDDFGLRGSPPTHPELLDWLACEFSDHGWSLKELIRRIVSSDAYQRSSAVRTDLVDVDPKNLWLARQNRFRLPGEVLRDLTLQASQLLDDRIGGPSVRPPLPAGVADLGYAGSVKWQESTGGDRYRRGCYIFFQRTVPYPLLMTFDGPDSNVTCQRRERSNTPLQSLTLLNDPAFIEAAQAWGRQLQVQTDVSPSDRLRTLFARVVQRESTEAELQALSQLQASAQARFAAHPEDAVALCGTGVDETEAVQTATWITLARVLLNLDEFVTRE